MPLAICRVDGFDNAPLYLLEPIDERDRWITRRLYGGGDDDRVAQEILLGVGGVRALRGARPPRRRLSLQRGARGVRRARADPPRARARARSFERRGRGARADRLHHPHAGRRRQREARPRAAAPARRGLRASARAELERIGGRPVQHDGGRRCGCRARANAVAELHGETARKMWRARRATPRPSSRSPTASIIACGRTRACATPPDGADDALDDARASRSSASCSTRFARRTGVQLDRRALTIGFARRATAYKRATLLFRDRPRAAPLLASGQRAAGVRRQGAPARPRRAARWSASWWRSTKEYPGQRRLPAELRPRARAPAHARLRRVAEHAAPAAGGVRHLGHEGGDERRAQPARSSTAGGPRRASTASTAGRIGDASCSATTASDDADAAALLRAARGESCPTFYEQSRALAAHDARVDRSRRAALLVGPHGARLLRAALSARGGDGDAAARGGERVARSAERVSRSAATRSAGSETAASHGGHEPPQSIFSSSPLRMPSLQLGARQRAPLHTRETQSLPPAHKKPVAQAGNRGRRNRRRSRCR